MKKLHYNKYSRKALKFWLIPISCLLLLVVALLAAAADKPNDAAREPVPNNEKIYITADKLISDSNSYSFEFIGNVKATQGDSVITADRLKVFYNKDAEQGNGLLAGEQTIQKIIAEGRVVITFEDRVATAEQAVYTTENKILVLSGPGAKITKGDDAISGETITLYRVEERIKVESGKEERVEAVFHAGERGIN